MKAKIALLCMVFVVALAAVATALPISIGQVKIDGQEISANAENRLDIQRGEEIDVKVKLLASEDINDVELDAMISGLEYPEEKATDHKGPLNLEAGVEYSVSLKLYVSDEYNENDYKLRLYLSDRNSEALTANYNLKIDIPRHDVKIADVLFFPERKIESGKALLTTVRLENMGEKDQSDVKVKVSMPELDLSATSYINEIESQEQEETEEVYMKLPACVEPGLYEIKITVEYNNGNDKKEGTSYIEVLQNADCVEDKEETQVIIPTVPTEGNAEAVSAVSDSKATLRKALEVVLFVLIVLLVIIGLIVGFTRLRNNEDEY